MRGSKEPLRVATLWLSHDLNDEFAAHVTRLNPSQCRGGITERVHALNLHVDGTGSDIAHEVSEHVYESWMPTPIAWMRTRYSLESITGTGISTCSIVASPDSGLAQAFLGQHPFLSCARHESNTFEAILHRQWVPSGLCLSSRIHWEQHSMEEVTMSIPAGASVPNERSAMQVARESALGEISDVLLNFEHTISRAKKALTRVRKLGGDHNVELALLEAIADLERTHKRLMQDTYYAGDSVRLI